MSEYSKKLIDLITAQSGKSVKLAKVFCNLLTLSEATAYRKINGTIDLTVEEFFILIKHFKINIGQISDVDMGFLFKGNLVYNDNISVLNYFKDTTKFLEVIEQGGGTLHNLSKDIPLFYYFFHDELGWFKIFFMLKYILLDPAYEQKKFSMHFKDEALIKIAKQYTARYQEVHTTEVWNLESVNTTLHQLEYAFTTGMMDDGKVGEKIFDQLTQILNLANEQCKVGYKFDINSYKQPKQSTFNLYHNDLYLAHNSYYLEMPNAKYSFVSFGVFNYIFTEDKNFNQYTSNHFDNIKIKSISMNSSSSERAIFFSKLIAKVAQVKKLCLAKIDVNY